MTLEEALTELTHFEREYEFKQRFIKVANHITNKYGLEIEMKELSNPNTGEFNGKVIWIDWK
ncbi:hypothetical protein ACKI1L_38705, partial [Streptomyces scabiei]|uniref:hypothetical protein n=1 Tax=Streptomyces scabiei TaxID=1930 RepID=UPI0038F81BE2